MKEQDRTQETDYLPREGIGIHGTTSYRLDSILSKGLDRRRYDPKNTAGIDFCIIHKKRDLPILTQLRMAVEESWRFADKAVERDLENGIHSTPVFLIIKPTFRYRESYGGPKVYTNSPVPRKKILHGFELHGDRDSQDDLDKIVTRVKEFIALIKRN